jgi:nicotinate-nucleotide pyrophosphorylase (carboxylating)
MKETLNFLAIDEIIKNALIEDIGTGDITTTACVAKDSVSRERLISKDKGVLCGLPVFIRVFALLDARIKVTVLKDDGEEVVPGDIIATLEGPSAGILTGERVALNFLQRLSGISTRTSHAVELVKGTKTKIVDTRKTTPGLRVLEKYAVRTGGGTNHRYSLADGVLIKDNHIKAAGSITKAVNSARKIAPHALRIEVECESIPQIDEALQVRADTIMLDNMTLEDMTEAVERINDQAFVEASGNMGSKDLALIAALGVDFISIGSLTNSVSALDVSLRFEDDAR